MTSRPLSTSFLSFSTLLLVVAWMPMTCLAAHINAQRPADPFADPAHDLYNPLRYIANNIVTTIALVCFLVTTLALFFNMWKAGAKYMLCMCIGGLTYCLGLALRYGLHSQPESRGIYIPEYLFVVLSPCAYIAAVYILLGRLAAYLEMGKYVLVPPHKVMRVFVTSDIVTFLIQAAGGATTTSQDTKARNTGRVIFLIGLVLQLCSFFFFTCLLISWGLRVRRNERATWTRDKVGGKPWYLDWRTLFFAMLVSCAGILVRSVYRCVEIGEGFTGYLATHEAYFYGLDALPLLIAIIVYVPFWPGRFISATPLHHPADADIEPKEEYVLDSTPARA